MELDNIINEQLRLMKFANEYGEATTIKVRDSVLKEGKCLSNDVSKRIGKTAHVVLVFVARYVSVPLKSTVRE